MIDETEEFRRQMQSELNSKQADRETLEREHGRVWDTLELSLEFEVVGFAAPLVVVRRKYDGQKGSLYFQHSPRYYFNFKPNCRSC
jgi:hypothetical protein